MSGEGRTYRCGSLIVDGQTGILYRGGELVPLAPKVTQTLAILLENHGKVVDKGELLRAVWPDAFVEEGNLHHNISVLRKLLRSDDEAGTARIETIPKRGYRLMGDVTLVERGSAEQHDTPVETTESPEVVTMTPAVVAREPETASTRRLGERLVASGFAIVLCIGVALFLLGFRKMSGTEPRPFAAPANSIAVLPFSNLSSDPQADYLGDGLTDELIHALTRVPSLRVVGRTSSFQFKGRAVDLREIGERLQARLVLEGSVQKAGNRLRITAQLIDATTGLHIWSERFDRQFDDLFAIQDQICDAIAGALRMELSRPAGSWRSPQKTASLEAYTLYLRGLKEWNRRNSAGVRAGREFFERSLALDHNYAPAWAGLADTLVHSGIWAILPADEAFPKAKVAALRAIELDSQLAEPHTALGYIQGWYERNHQSAEASFHRALDLSPGYVWGRQRLASYLSARGRHEEALAEHRRAIELDPISTSANSGLALAYFWARQYDRAIEQCARTREIDPQFPLTFYYLAHSLEQKHLYEEAIAALKEGTRLWGSTDGMMLAELYAAAPGHRTEAIAQLKNIQRKAAGSPTQPYQMALIYVALGDKETALGWLDRASRERDPWFLYANVDPRLDQLRSDERFRQLMKRLGLS